MIRFTQKGDYHKVTNYLEKLKHVFRMSILDKYGRLGVEALREATPTLTGETANAWYYRVEGSSKSAKLSFYNSHFNKGVPIAIILQYGHGTGTGGWVEGRDYINPAVQPVFDDLVKSLWKEVTSL